jgi:hypothetical protein
MQTVEGGMHSDGTMMYICRVAESRNNQIYNFKEAATNKTLLK